MCKAFKKDGSRCSNNPHPLYGDYCGTHKFHYERKERKRVQKELKKERKRPIVNNIIVNIEQVNVDARVFVFNEVRPKDLGLDRIEYGKDISDTDLVRHRNKKRRERMREKRDLILSKRRKIN